MGAKQFVTIEELAQLKDIKIWRLRKLSSQGILPIRHLHGEPIIPYEIDLEKFNEMESVKGAARQKNRSLKIEELLKNSRHRKEPLWLK